MKRRTMLNSTSSSYRQRANKFRARRHPHACVAAAAVWTLIVSTILALGVNLVLYGYIAADIRPPAGATGSFSISFSFGSPSISSTRTSYRYREPPRDEGYDVLTVVHHDDLSTLVNWGLGSWVDHLVDLVRYTRNCYLQSPALPREKQYYLMSSCFDMISW